MPAKYLLAPGALLELASQREDSALYAWSKIVNSDAIQTSVVAMIKPSRITISCSSGASRFWCRKDRSRPAMTDDVTDRSLI